MQKHERHHPLRRITGLAFSCVVLLTMLMTGGCQPKQTSSAMDDWAYDGDAPRYYSRSGESKGGDNLHIREQWEDRALELVLDTANVAKGTPYVYGGTSLSGFDCSGLVRWAYRTVGVDLPRSAREQAQYGEKVARSDLRMGDIVAFRHPKRGYHTGIYVGDGKFIHSPRRRDVVKISALTDAYFKDTYLGARRPSLPNDVDLKQVEESLVSIKAQKKALQTAQNSQKIRSQTKPATLPKAKSRAQSKKSDKKKLVVSSKNKTTSSNKSKQSAMSSSKAKLSTTSKDKPKAAVASSSKNKQSTTASKAKAKQSTASSSKATTTNKSKQRAAPAGKVKTTPASTSKPQNKNSKNK